MYPSGTGMACIFCINFEFEIVPNPDMKICQEVTGDPRIMRISLLQFFKTFLIYLANVVVG